MSRYLFALLSLSVLSSGAIAGDQPAFKAKVKVSAQTVGAAAGAAAQPKTTGGAYAGILKSLGEASAALNKAMQSAAQGPRSQQEELKQLEATRVQVEAALKQLATRRDQVTKAAQAQAVAVRSRAYATGNYGVRADAGRNDATERFAVLMPGGPLIVEVELTRDGKPFRIAREELIDDMLAGADKDEDGKVKWLEALQSPRFTMGRIRLPNEQQRGRFIQSFDANRDGLVDRGEARLLMARYFGGAVFQVAAGSQYRGYGAVVYANGRAIRQTGGSADVSKLLDTSKDGVLDAQEIEAAAERLKSRDADDNDLLYAAEINGTAPARSGQRVTVTAGGMARGSQTQVAVLLGSAAQPEQTIRILRLKYGTDNGRITKAGFPADPDLFDRLDANDDGFIETGEVQALNEIEPHVRLEANVGKGTDRWMTVVAAADGLDCVDESDRSVSIQRDRVRVKFSSPQAPQQQQARFGASAQSYIQRFDGDSNGYLEKDELQGGLVQQFELWDANSDGKVFKKEIETALERMQAPQRSQMRASVSHDGNPLFKAIDRSGDSRLSLREMRTAYERIAEFDANSDGQVTKDEIPVSMSVSFSAGFGSYGYYQVMRQPQQQLESMVDAPEWFVRMDRNGDGDVTLKEFPGTKADFEKLDTNDDGFVEPAEATAAGE